MRQVVSFALGVLIAASSAAGSENPRLQQLTDTGARNGQAHFSPDGQRISLVSNREGSWQVYVMSADGSAARRLTDEPEPAGWPSWSPEAAWIYYYARRVGRYALMRIPSEGGVAQVVLADEFDSFRPSPSPDGALLLFDRHGATQPPNHDLYVLRVSDGRLRRITLDTGYDSDARWSPAGDRIVFQSGRESPGSDPYERMNVFVMSADGTNLRKLTSDGTSRYPAWSPKGDRITYVSERSGNRDIWVVDVDGTDANQLTQHPGQDDTPVWAPDGRTIVFSSDREGEGQELYALQLSDE